MLAVFTELANPVEQKTEAAAPIHSVRPTGSPEQKEAQLSSRETAD